MKTINILKHCDKQQGFTIIELLVGITIATIVSAAAFAALTSSSKATRANDQTAQTQQNARVAMEVLSHDIKMAGYGTGGPINNCATAIVPSDNTVAGNDTGPDSLSLIVPTPVGTITTPVAGPITAITLSTTGGLAPTSPISIGGVATTTVASIAGPTVTLATTLGAPAAFPANTQVYWLQCVTYQVIRATDANAAICGGSAPCLARGVEAPLLAGRIDCNGPGGMNVCVAIAEGIEDLQISYACDGCNAAVNSGVADRVVDDQGALDNVFGAGDFVSNNSWVLTPMTPDAIRLVLVSIVARETRIGQGFGEGNSVMTNTSGPMIVQDHDPSADPGYVVSTYQQFRRRLVTRTIEVRNIGI
jgi:type IV pilus assembly protein PilW